MNNKIIAAIFNEMADILDIMNIKWKPQAFRRAARSLEAIGDDVSIIYEKKGKKGLLEIAGIGQNIANKIIEFLKTGKIKEYQQIKKKLPKGLPDIIEISSLGPKKVKVLYQKLNIKNIKDLERAAKSGQISKLNKFGLKSEKEILEGIILFKNRGKMMLLGEAKPLADQIVAKLEKVPGVKRVVIAGSIRRWKEVIGDIDILATASRPDNIINAFVNMALVKKTQVKGPTKASVILRNNKQCDLRVLDDKRFGAALQYFTGDKLHNIAVRKIAIKKGYKLSEYGLFSRKTGKLIAATSEDAIYKRLGMQTPPPEIRLNSGEIEAALKKNIPKLVELKDIKGDFQIHTEWSDGSNSIEEMAQAAKKLRYKYIAITDHTKKVRIANGLNEKKLLKQIKEIKKINKKINGIKILASTEVDILEDGKLDISNNILKKLNIVTASVHFGRKRDKATMTKRIIKAMENKYVNILGHPTGRLINQRPRYELNMNAIYKAAKKNNVCLEINASPSRLDINGAQVRDAIKQGVKIVINTDAHTDFQLSYMLYGVAQARIGWAQKNDIINTYNLSRLKKIFPRIS